ncbi:MAG: hypothetical protein WD267_04545 [Balneolales bacterium]
MKTFLITIIGLMLCTADNINSIITYSDERIPDHQTTSEANAFINNILGSQTPEPEERLSEYKMLMTLPEGIYASQTVSKPDKKGFIRFHQQEGKWYQAGYQRGGARHFLGGVIAGDVERMEDGWRSLEATFSRQLDNGDFKAVPRPWEDEPQSFDARIETNYFYLQAVVHGLLVLQDSPHAHLFEDRVMELKPKVDLAAQFIMSGREGIVDKVGHTANRLFIAAKALGLAGVYVNNEEYINEAKRLVSIALNLRDEQGVFLERGGRDSSYNAVSMLFAQIIAIYLPDPKLDEAMQQAAEWQLTRIMPDGEVLAAGNTRTGPDGELTRGGTGGPKSINTREVGLAMVYHGLIYDRPKATEAGMAIIKKRLNN